MKRYLFIIILLIIALVYIKNYEIESPNLKFSLHTISEVESNFLSEPLQKELENILSSDLLLESMIIKRNNDSFLELGDNFDIAVSFSYPNFEYTPTDVINNKKLYIKSSNIFKPLKIDLLDLWSQKDNLPKYSKRRGRILRFFHRFRRKKYRVCLFLRWTYKAFRRRYIGGRFSIGNFQWWNFNSNWR